METGDKPERTSLGHAEDIYITVEGVVAKEVKAELEATAGNEHNQEDGNCTTNVSYIEEISKLQNRVEWDEALFHCSHIVSVLLSH